MNQIWFFGCFNRPGHYLFVPPGMSCDEPMEGRNHRLPRASSLDGSAVFLPYPEKRGEGALTYLPANNLNVLAWWGNNPWDGRGAVSNSILLRVPEAKSGAEPDFIWAEFVRAFPKLGSSIAIPHPIKRSEAER